MEEVSAFTCNDKKVCEDLILQCRKNELLLDKILKKIQEYEKVINKHQNNKGIEADRIIKYFIKFYNDLLVSRAMIIKVEEDDMHNNALDEAFMMVNEMIECELFDKLMQNSKSFMDVNTEDIINLYRPNKLEKIEEKIVEQKQEVVEQIVEQVAEQKQEIVEQKQEIVEQEQEIVEQIVEQIAEQKQEVVEQTTVCKYIHNQIHVSTTSVYIFVIVSKNNLHNL